MRLDDVIGSFIANEFAQQPIPILDSLHHIDRPSCIVGYACAQSDNQLVLRVQNDLMSSDDRTLLKVVLVASITDR